jgi:hypothetical protein
MRRWFGKRQIARARDQPIGKRLVALSGEQWVAFDQNRAYV